MTPLFKKLNLKDQQSITVLNAPESFEPELRVLGDVEVRREIRSKTKFAYAICFVATQNQLDKTSVAMAAAADHDAILWIAYPKSTSKRYKCTFNRDSGWSVLGRAGFERVRQVSIDEDWSALRFRRVDFIKALTRAPERAITQAGRLRLTK